LKYPVDVQKGIILHREIDSFTESCKSASILSSRRRVAPRYRMYASVIFDVFYDHFLAANWLQYSKQESLLFATNTRIKDELLIHL